MSPLIFTTNGEKTVVITAPADFIAVITITSLKVES